MGIPTTAEVIDMRLIETIFALIGVCATVTVVFFYIGYTIYNPPCSNPLAVFARACK
jgi:phage shock protein PspC (stress-responsive transcriptional regulator)